MPTGHWLWEKPAEGRWAGQRGQDPAGHGRLGQLLRQHRLAVPGTCPGAGHSASLSWELPWWPIGYSWGSGHSLVSRWGGFLHTRPRSRHSQMWVHTGYHAEHTVYTGWRLLSALVGLRRGRVTGQGHESAQATAGGSPPCKT